ncbi:MAG: sulfite exporter TauE/SafE family protein [Magnetovibrionaceae bacterium]
MPDLLALWPASFPAPHTTAGILAAFFVAGFIKGASGLGFSTSCMPLLTFLVGLKGALGLIILPSLASNLMVMRDAGGFQTAVKRFWPLYLSLLPGLALGLFLLGAVDQIWAGAALGIVLIGYGLFTLSRGQEVRLRPGLESSKWMLPTGITTGFVNGLTGSQVMPMMPYLLALGLQPGLFVQAINISFTFSTLVMVAGLAKLDILSVSSGVIGLMGLLPVFVGVKFGGIVRRRLNDKTFRKLVLMVLIALGIGLLTKPLLGGL